MHLRPEIQEQLAAKNVMVFDGVCNLCNGWVKFVLRFDTHKNVSFVTAQSDLGEAIFQDLGLKSDDYETFIVVRNGQIYTKLDGLFALFGTMGGFWKILSIGRILPRFIKNPTYDLVAKNRYRVFGKQDTCLMPSPDIKDRFLT